MIWPRNLMWPSTGSKMVSQPFFALTSHVLTCGFLISLIRCILNPPYRTFSMIFRLMAMWKHHYTQLVYMCGTQVHVLCATKLCKTLKRNILDIITRGESFLFLAKLTSETNLARTRPLQANPSIFTVWQAELCIAILTFKTLGTLAIPLKAGASIITDNILTELCLKFLNSACHVCFRSLT